MKEYTSKKTYVNEEWKNYIYNELKRGIHKDVLEDILIKENVRCDVISKLLYNDNNKSNYQLKSVSEYDELSKTFNINDDNKLSTTFNINDNDYKEYVNNVINNLELNNIEKSLYDFFKTQKHLKEKNN